MQAGITQCAELGAADVLHCELQLALGGAWAMLRALEGWQRGDSVPTPLPLKLGNPAASRLLQSS